MQGIGGIAHCILLAVDYFTENCGMDPSLSHKTISIRSRNDVWLKYNFYRSEGELTHLLNYLEDQHIEMPPDGFVLNFTLLSDIYCITV